MSASQSNATVVPTAATALDDDPFAAAYPEAREFWQAAARGEFLLKSCDDCQRAHWYPRVICPLCGSERTRWQAASGRATVHAFSPARKADPPYVLAYVILDEGPMVMTNLITADPESLRIGDRVNVTWRAAAEGRTMPFFELTQVQR